MRNNASNPSIGHVIMFGAATVGWLVLFVISLASAPGATFWIKVIFSGIFVLISAFGTVFLLRRVLRAKRSTGQS